jgi:hypothetical protein
MTMNALRFLRLPLISLGVVLIAALSLVSSATATSSTVVTRRDVVIDRLHPGFTRTCGFPVYIHAEGFTRTVTHLDADGKPTMINTQTVLHGTVSANTKSLRLTFIDPVKIVFNDDGTQTHYIHGVTHRNAPGEGIVAGQAGLVIVQLTFDAAGRVISEEVLFQAGLDEPLFEVCPLLAPDA